MRCRVCHRKISNLQFNISGDVCPGCIVKKPQYFPTIDYFRDVDKGDFVTVIKGKREIKTGLVTNESLSSLTIEEKKYQKNKFKFKKHPIVFW